MTKLFILLTRIGSKRPIGAIPVKRGVSMAKARVIVKKRLKKGFKGIVITSQQLKKFFSRKRTKKRKSVRRPKIRRKRKMMKRKKS